MSEGIRYAFRDKASGLYYGHQGLCGWSGAKADLEGARLYTKRGVSALIADVKDDGLEVCTVRTRREVTETKPASDVHRVARAKRDKRQRDAEEATLRARLAQAQADLDQFRGGK